MLRHTRPLALIALLSSLSGCSWYWEKSKQIGEYMPTYEGWFGDGEKEKAEARAASAYQVPDPRYYAPVPPAAPVSDPSARMMPVPGNPTSGYGQYTPPAPPSLPYAGNMPPAPYGAMPPSGYGTPPGMGPGPDPAEGLNRLQMQQMQPTQGGYAPPQQMPFTEPLLEQAPAQVEETVQTPVEEYAGTVTATEPAAATTRPERGTFSFLDDIAETVGGWFGDEGEKAPYPTLGSVPESEGYKKRMEEAEAARTELEAAHADAAAKHSAIDDWSDLADPQTAPMPETQIILPNHPTDSTAGLASKTLPSNEYEPLPLEKTQPSESVKELPVSENVPAPTPVVEAPVAALPPVEKPEPSAAPQPEQMQIAAPEQGHAPIEIKPEVTTPAPAMQPQFLRRPAAPEGALLPRNRYADRY